MKKIMLLALFSLAGCIDIVHYISFNDRGQTVSSMQIGFASALLESDSGGRDMEEIKEKLLAITNSTFSQKTDDANIRETNFIVSNSVIYGVQNRLTAPKHYFTSSNQSLFPVKESYGFSLKMGDELKKSSKENEIFEGADSEMGALIAMMVKYRILLSKADLPRPLAKVVLAFPEKEREGVEIPFTDYGTMYMIDIPFNETFMEAQKMEFHFAPK